MPKISKHKVIIVVGSLLVALIFAAICLSPRPSSIDVDVTFAGFTNFAKSSVTAASFCVSNCGKVAVFQWPMMPSDFEFKSPSSPILLGHFTQSSMLISGKPLILKSGETIKIYVTTPTNRSRPWRVWYGFARADWRFKLDQMPPPIHSVVTRFIPRRWLVIRPEIEVTSDWVAGPESDKFQPGTNQPWEFPHSISP